MSEPDLHIEDQGSGSPALVFLHYFAGSSRSWIHVADGLSNASRCVRLDVPGFGRSPPLSTYSVSEVAQVVAAVIARLRLESYVLIGHSMGGKPPWGLRDHEAARLGRISPGCAVSALA